jgi:hypothetical protein
MRRLSAVIQNHQRTKKGTPSAVATEVAVVVQGKCQGYVFSDFVSKVTGTPLGVFPQVQIERSQNAVDHLRPAFPAAS